MNLINDIYYRMDSSIVKQNFWKLDIEEKKSLIDKELKKYIISKLNLLKLPQLSVEEIDSLNVGELLLILANNIPKEEHFNTLRHFTHYILQVAGTLQGWSIIWWEEDNEKLEKSPIIEFNEFGFWNSLKTHENTDYVKTFNFVYDIFNNQFMIKQHKKELVLTPLNNDK